ncbi:hypothetical protein [Deinococcus sp. RIT780]|uniref:hypothetical protein n=1 Tax=Deinococcus sp. RIT780 TaxID=2870472 RepID=UPI001C8AF4F3|nr:hypothetical protein [Deinococcus sp. RIT780]MBX8465149.1 hypothetical protein [Deinococcus sp. RIT780]
MNEVPPAGIQRADWVSLDALVVCAPGVPSNWRDALHHDWGLGRVQASDRPVDTAARTIEFRVGTLPPAPAGVVTREVALPDGAAPVQVLGDELWLGGHLHVQLGAHLSVLTCAPQGAAQDLWALAFTEAHRAAGWVPLHAALIAGRGGVVAVTGPSGAGKTTACLRLRAAGWTVLAEDRAWIGPDGRAAGLDRTLRALDDSLARFAPELLLDGPGIRRDARGKRLLPLTVPPVSLPLTAVLLLGHPGPLGAADRVREFWQATGVPLGTSGQQAVSGAAQRLVRTVPWRPADRQELMTLIPELLGSPLPDRP